MTHLFLGKPRADPYHIDHVTLHNTYVCKLAATKRIELLALPLALFLLLCQALVAVNIRQRERVWSADRPRL